MTVLLDQATGEESDRGGGPTPRACISSAKNRSMPAWRNSGSDLLVALDSAHSRPSTSSRRRGGPVRRRSAPFRPVPGRRRPTSGRPRAGRGYRRGGRIFGQDRADRGLGRCTDGHAARVAPSCKSRTRRMSREGLGNACAIVIRSSPRSDGPGRAPRRTDAPDTLPRTTSQLPPRTGVERGYEQGCSPGSTAYGRARKYRRTNTRMMSAQRPRRTPVAPPSCVDCAVAPPPPTPPTGPSAARTAVRASLTSTRRRGRHLPDLWRHAGRATERASALTPPLPKPL